ncbi:MAG: 50S ribosomal protein L1 [Candidatus Aenigmarchaeota archaeon]|nr:50S ribosomal protein L1 [Candidatus Aenigmarchaeota archaeon]
MKIQEAISHIRTDSKQRKFSQSFDLVINLKNIDLKKPESKFSKEIQLPHGRGKEINVGIMSDRISGAISRPDLEAIAADKKRVRMLVNEYEFFVAEAPLMPVVGKLLGKYLAPRGKMPKLLAPGRDHNAVVNELKQSVRVRVRDSPVIHAYVGSEKMSDQQIKENAERLLEEILKTLPKGRDQIKNVYLKTTMGNPVKIEL